MKDVEEEKVEVPVIAWERLEVSNGVNGIWCGAERIAALTLPDGKAVPVALKKLPQHSSDGKVWSPCLEETKVLRALSGVPGVPKLYGVTEGEPYAMVLSRCKGDTLDDLRRQGKVRCCLHALQEVCVILKEVHKRDYYHGDVQASNIVVQYTKNHCCMLVALVNFGKAGKLTDATKQRNVDEKMICILVREILLYMEKKDGTRIYNKRQKFLEDMEDTHNLDEIYSKLHHLLYSLDTHRSSTPHFLSKHC